MSYFPNIIDFESERLLFRKLTIEDAAKLFKIYSDKEAMKYRHSRPMTTAMEAAHFVETQKQETAQNYIIRKGIALKSTKELIGTIMLKYFKTQITISEIGYSIGKDYWNQGYGKEIVHSLTSYFQKNTPIKQLKAWTIKENIAAQKILEWNDFQLTDQAEYPESFLYLKKW